jgi:predicted Zn-dependent protease
LKNLLMALALLCGLTLINGGEAKAAPLATKLIPAEECGTLTNKEAGVQFTIPKGWKCEEEGGNLTVSSPDDGVAVSFVVVSDSTLDKAIDAAFDELGKIVKKPKIEREAVEVDVNNLKAVVTTGSGELDGHPVGWGINILLGKKPLVVIAVGAVESLKKYGPETSKMLDSFRRL